MLSIAGIRNRTRRVFYGWWIVAGSVVLQSLFSSMYLQAFGAYLVKFEAGFGWSRTSLAGAYSLARVESSIIGPIQG